MSSTKGDKQAALAKGCYTRSRYISDRVNKRDGFLVIGHHSHRLLRKLSEKTRGRSRPMSSENRLMSSVRSLSLKRNP